MLKNLTIRAKTRLGFGLILFVTASMVTFAIRRLPTGSESFKTHLSQDDPS